MRPIEPGCLALLVRLVNVSDRTLAIANSSGRVVTVLGPDRYYQDGRCPVCLSRDRWWDVTARDELLIACECALQRIDDGDPDTETEPAEAPLEETV